MKTNWNFNRDKQTGLSKDIKDVKRIFIAQMTARSAASHTASGKLNTRRKKPTLPTIKCLEIDDRDEI